MALDGGDIAIIVTLSVVGGIFLLILLYHLSQAFVVVGNKTVVIVERWGRFSGKLEAGLHFLVPFADRVRTIQWREYETFVQAYNEQTVQVVQRTVSRIDLRETVMDFPFQSIITRDNVEIKVHPMLLYKLVDPVKVAYESYDICHCVEKLVQTTLRSIIGDMGLDDTLASREEINRSLSNKISDVCLNWGFLLTRVDILEIVPTATVQQAMHKQLAAERIRRADIVTADGYRQQQKTEAEGAMQKSITESKGHQTANVIRAKSRADAKILVAKAEAESVRLIASAVKEYGVDATQYLIALRYIETLTSIAANASQRIVYMPFQSEIVGSTRILGKA